jgi:hypothetical protein
VVDPPASDPSSLGRVGVRRVSVLPTTERLGRDNALGFVHRAWHVCDVSGRLTQRPAEIQEAMFAEMAEPLIYVDVAEVRAGVLADLKEGIAELAEFIEQNEPQLLSYNVYFSDDGTRMSVVHVHADPASLDRHLEIAGPRFARFVDLVTLRSIHIYGRPSENALRQLRDKLQLLGSGDVVVCPPHVGFVRSHRIDGSLAKGAG